MNKSKLREQKGKIMKSKPIYKMVNGEKLFFGFERGLDRKATDLEQLRQDLLGACARGYTHDENSSKELDSDLIKAMVEELMTVFQSNRKAILEEVRKKVIGDDEKRFFRENINALKHETRNELRKEQRQKLSLLEGKK